MVTRLFWNSRHSRLPGWICVIDAISAVGNYDFMKAIVVSGIKKQHKLMSKTNEYALFWENLYSAFKDCRAMEDQDFKLKDHITKPIKIRKNGEHFMLSNKDFDHSVIYLNVDACISSI